MSQTLTKPILLDETGQAIKQALQNIDETEAQDWLLTYEDVHSEMDDNVDRIADALEAIQAVMESGEWYPKELHLSIYPDWCDAGTAFDMSNVHVYVYMVKDVQETYITGQDTKQIDITSQCTLSHKNGDILVPNNATITATWTYGKTGITYTDSVTMNVRVPTFSSGHWENALAAHYDPDVDFSLYDYWSVGDECDICIDGVLETGDDTDKRRSSNTFVILHKGGKELVTPINGQTECAFVLGTKDLIYNHPNNSGVLYNVTAVKKAYDDNGGDDGTYNGNWEISTLRTYLNGTFKDASFLAHSTPEYDFKPNFKQFYNVSSKTPESDETIQTADYFAVASMKEIFGVTEITEGSYAGTVVNGEDNLIQFDYYKTTINRIKSVPSDSYADSVTDHIWVTRSTSVSDNYHGVIWVWGKDSNSDKEGKPFYSGIKYAKALSPICVI